ncbi:hypothetical protein OSSY52_09390 [Tepiditoga spiralis]|uniref:Solute-binding protein family 3/N-terminal domain-containing protein n=1 Tax=Tepiditoga spiralis TaxID=2108365 RepID=A0A7G1G326_9BACT|nr:transporter substrate-binding domain-containing protein [Tepiditoga spiralis]BBE30798.1 hypothetical protein OSSY52_09390 [Tepiditoga spiralis]
MKKVLFLILGLLIFVSMFSRTVTFAAIDWPPFTGPTLDNYGFHSEISIAAMKKMGYEVKIEFVPWQRALNMVRSGKYDGLFTIYYSDERAQYYAFTDVVSTSNLVFFKKKGKDIPNNYKTFEDLKKYTFGVVRGYKNTDEFDKADYLMKENANNSEENLKKLIFGRIDILVDSKETILDLLNKKYQDFVGTLDIINPPLQTFNVYNAFSKAIPDYKKLVEDFNKGLQMIKKDGTYDKILKKHGMK